MKKNKKLVIGLIIIVVLVAVAAWYFFFRTDSQRVGNGNTDSGSEGTNASTGNQDEADLTDVTTKGSENTEIVTRDEITNQACPIGTTGVYPNCTEINLSNIITDNMFLEALNAAKIKVRDNPSIGAFEKIRAMNIIDTLVPMQKNTILADASSGKDIVQIILEVTQRTYQANWGQVIILV